MYNYAPGYAGNPEYTATPYSRANRSAYSGSSMRSINGMSERSEASDLLRDLLGKNGIDWPLGLRILPPGPQTKELRSEVETLFKLVILQEASGHVNHKLVSKIERDLQMLRRLLNEHSDQLVVPPYTIREAQRFLKRLKDLVEVL
jgi:hypothetical protein